MLIAHFSNPLIGVMSDVYLSSSQDEKWQEGRIEALSQASDSAIKNKAELIIISGMLFGDVYVTDEMISRVLDILGEKNCRFLWLIDASGQKYMKHKNTLPSNIEIISMESIMDGSAEESVRNIASAINSDNEIISTKLENTCFDDKGSSGYWLIDYNEKSVRSKTKVELSVFNFKTFNIHVDSDEGHQAVVIKCKQATLKCTRNDFIRIILSGDIELNSYINSDDLRSALKQRVFFVEIYNGCTLHIDENDYEGDISLKSEYIRMVLADDSLSESEKSRIIQCGWNALSGKELSE